MIPPRQSPWSQMTPMGGVGVPNPMRQAGQQFQHARDQFRTAQRQGPGPQLAAARQQFEPMREWFSGLRDTPPGQQQGMAAMGPPHQFAPPQLAPTMPVPTLPGMDQNSSMQDLIALLQQRTAGQIPQGPQPQPNGGDSFVNPPGADPTGGFVNPFWGAR